MNLKWLLFIVPISTFLVTVPALSQNVKTIPAGESNQYPKIQNTAADTATGLAGAYGMNGSNITEWYQRPGEMPVFVPDSTLTEAMPILIAPDVDSKMVIPMGSKSNDEATDPKKP